MSAALPQSGSVAIPGDPGQRRLRIALIITGLELGGGGAVTYTITNAIDQSRFELDVYCIIEGGPMEGPVRATGCNVTILDGTYDYRRRFITYDPIKILRLAAALRRKQYDVVHTHLYHADVVGRLAALWARRPVVVKSLHNMGRWKSGYQVAIDRTLNRWTDKIICCSDYQREVAGAQERFAPHQAVTIAHGVHLPRFGPRIDRAAYRTSLGLKPDRVLVGTIGRPIAEKGHEFLLEAMPDVLRAHPQTEFLIVGEGNLRDALAQQAARAGVQDRLHFAGARSDIPELLAMMDVFVFPSVSEGFGIAVIEAMASRLPVVVSNIRPLADIVQDGVSGLLVPSGDGPALAAALNRVLADPDLRRRLSQGGRDLVEARYTDRHMVQAHEELYLSLTRAAISGTPAPSGRDPLGRRAPQAPMTVLQEAHTRS